MIDEDLIHDKEHIENIILEQLSDCLETHNAGEAVQEIVEIDTYSQTITVKFKYNIVPEDDYIGLGTY